MSKLNTKVFLITILFVVSTLLCSCGKENEDEYGNQTTKPEGNGVVTSGQFRLPKYKNETIASLFDGYRINIHTDFAHMDYDADEHTIIMEIDSSNCNESEVTITADAIVDGNKNNVEYTEYEVSLAGIEGAWNNTYSDTNKLKIKLNDGYSKLLDSIDIVFEITSSCGKHISTTPCEITDFYIFDAISEESYTPKVYAAHATNDSDIWLDDEINVEDYEYLQATGRSLLDALNATEGSNAEAIYEEIQNERLEKREQEIEETKLNELQSKGRMEVGNDKIGYLELQDTFVEVSNEDDKIVYENNDEFGDCVVSIYTDSLDMTEMYPLSAYGSNLCQSFLDAGGNIETVSFHLAEYKKQSIGLVSTIAENASEETPLIFIGFLESPFDESKVIVVQCDFSVNSQNSRDLGMEIFSSYRHPFYYSTN